MTIPAPHDRLTSAWTGLLFGREQEQALLLAWLGAALHGRGRLALISGEAGIGKSALAAWLAAEARERGADACFGRCDDLSLTPPYGPWREALARLDESAAGIPLLTASGDSLESVASQSTLFARVAAGLASASLARPLVIVLEDLHWADPASLDLLRFLARGIDALPLLLVATYRGDEVRPRQPLFELLPPLVRDPRTERIDLGPLPISAWTALVRARYALSPPDEARLAGFLEERAAGNPFYLTESLRALESRRVLVLEDERWVLGNIEGTTVPPLIRQIVEGRLVGLDAETLGLLEIAAVIGQEAPLDLWQVVSGAGRERLLVAAEHAAGARLVLDQTGPGRLDFAHALVRDTLYARQSVRRRQSTHRRVAEALAGKLDMPPSLVASHFAAADDPRAVDWLVRSGEQALALYAARDAVAALTLAQEMASRFARTLPPAAYRTRAAAATLLGEFDRARRDLELALDQGRLSGDRHAEWQALLDLGMLWAERDYDRTIGYYRVALTLARAMGDDQTIAYSLNRVANWHVNRDEPEMALPLHEEALSLFRARDDRAGIADTLDFLGVASYLDSDFRRATSSCEEAIPLFRELDDRPRLSSCLGVLALSGGDLTLIAAPTFREATYWIRAGDEAVAIAREIGWPAGEASARFCLSNVFACRGDLGRGLRDAEESLAIAERIGHEQWSIAARQTLGAVWGELLAPERALPVLEQALAAARDLRSPLWTNTVVATIAPLLVAEGELARAEAILGTVGQPSSAHRSLSQRQVRFAQAELTLARGAPDRALSMADDLVATRPRPTPDDPLPQLVKLRGDALAQLGRTSEAEAAYLAARDGARLLGYRPLLWRIDRTLGTLWATLGRGAEADESFMRARATIEDMTSTLDDPELREEFRARAQGRLPRSMPAGSGSGAPVVDRLSPRERDVLRYLVAGQSDREIAAALSISPRTVMHHVSRILDKLGASSRTAAATLAVREGLV